MTVIGDLLKQVKEFRYNIGSGDFSHYPGYRQSAKSNARWDKIESDKEKMHAEWAERDAQIKRQKVVDKARRMIEWSYNEYTREKANRNHGIKILALLTLHWSPQRVLSKHKDFAKLCRALKDEKTWRMLTVKERAFIADAVGR